MKYCYKCFTKIENDAGKFCPNCGKNQSDYFAQSFELPAGTFLYNKRYLVGESLGAGGFGITYLGFDTKLKRKIVIKETFYNGIFKRNCYNTNNASPLSVSYDSTISLDEIMRKTEKECLSLSKAENIKNIIKVYDWFSENNTAYIITEYINGETLYDHVVENGAYSWESLYEKIRPLMISLAILHKNDLIHRDIKPHNIMISNNGYEEEFILIDFGLARSSDVQTLSTAGVSFTPGFAPFEQRSLTYPDGTYTDVYSLASTIYFSLTAEIPLNIQSPDLDVTFPKLREIEDTGVIPKNVADALRCALNQNFKSRCQTIDEFLGMLDNKASSSQTVKAEKESNNTVFAAKETHVSTPAAADRTISVKTSDSVSNAAHDNSSSVNYQPVAAKSKKTPIIAAACAVVVLVGVIGAVIAGSGDKIPSSESTSSNTESYQQTSSVESEKFEPQSQQETSSVVSDKSAEEVKKTGKVYYLNYKPEQAESWVELAKKYESETGVEVTVQTAAYGTYKSTLISEMAKSDAPTLFQVNGDKELNEWSDYCVDLKDTELYKELKSDDFALIEDNEVKGIAYVIESYGLIYNKTILNKYFNTSKAVVKSVDEINNFDTFKAVVEDIQSKKDSLGIRGAFTSAGMDSSSDWRFKTHLANIPIFYEYKKDNIGYTTAIKGTYLDNYRNIWELYIDNSTCNSSKISSKTSEDALDEFSLGEAVFYQNGTWVYRDIIDNGMSDDELGMLPIYTGIEGEENQGLCTGSENYWCVNSSSSQDDIDATIDFLNWVITSDKGRNALANEMGFVTPFKTFDSGYQPNNVLVDAANEYIAAGKSAVGWTFPTMPSDRWKDMVGDALLKYAEGTGKWSDVETAFVDGWKTEYEAAQDE